MRIYPALILNDYEAATYAQWVKDGSKKIETRMNRLFSHRGDLVICCGNTNSVGVNKGNALCIVNVFNGREMIKEDEEQARIEWHPKRKSLLLKGWRHFSRDFKFLPQYISGTYQGIFKISIPDDVEIMPKPLITDAVNYKYQHVEGKSVNELF